MILKTCLLSPEVNLVRESVVTEVENSVQVQVPLQSQNQCLLYDLQLNCRQFLLALAAMVTVKH